MTEGIALHGSTPGDPSGLAAKIDLSQYRTTELVDQLSELISVPAAFRKVIVTTLLLALLVVAACAAIFYFSELSGVGWILMSAYCLIVGFVFGFLLGVLRIIGAALLNIESVLRIILDLTGKAAADYQHVQTGKMQMPSGGELVGQVYDEVLLPALEQAVAGSFGFLGKPLLWAYRRSIGSAVRYLIKRVNRAQLTAEVEQTAEQQAAAGLSKLAEYSAAIRAYTSSASEIVANIGLKIRFYALRPLYILFAVALSLALVPLALVRYFANAL